MSPLNIQNFRSFLLSNIIRKTAINSYTYPQQFQITCTLHLFSILFTHIIAKWIDLTKTAGIPLIISKAGASNTAGI